MPPTPRTKRKRGKDHRRRTAARPVLDAEQTKVLLFAARATPVFVPVLLGVVCGMRREDVCGLRWIDVNLAAGTLSVEQVVVQLRHRTEVKAPKTESGRRTFALPSFVAEELARHQEAQRLQKLALGPAWCDTGYVVTMPDGKPMRPEYVTKTYIKLRRREGLPEVAFHDLRHTASSQWQALGIPLATVSARLGHSSPAITAQIYSHPLPVADREAARRIDEQFREAVERRSSDD
jgi:integrase